MGNQLPWAPLAGRILHDVGLVSLVRAGAGTFVHDGCLVHEATPNSKSIVVDAGNMYYEGVYLPNAGAILDLTSYIDAAYPTMCIIYIDSGGAPRVHAGSPTAITPTTVVDWQLFKTPRPATSTLPVGAPLALVYLAAGATSITNASISSVAVVRSDPGVPTEFIPMPEITEDGDVLTLDAIEPFGVKWAAPAESGSGGSVYNLLQNGNFTEVISNLPIGWALENTPALLQDAGEKDGFGNAVAIKITADASNEGIKYTLKNLKNSALYTVWCRAKVTAGDTASVVTTGATTNISLTTTSTSFVMLVGAFVTDASGTDVVLKLLAAASGDIVWFGHAVVVEGSQAPAYYIPSAGYHRIEIPAGAWKVPATNGATYAEDTGTNGTLDGHQFDQTTEEFLEAVIKIPENIDPAGTAIFQAIGYSATAAASKYIQLKLYHSAKAVNEVWDAAYSSVSSGDLSVSATQDQLDNHQWIKDVATLDWVANDQVRIRLSRIAPSGTNLAADYLLTAFAILIPRMRP